MADLFERIRMQMTADDASTIESGMRHMNKEMIAAQEKAAVAERKTVAAEDKVASAAGLFHDNQKLTAKVREAEMNAAAPILPSLDIRPYAKNI